MARPKKQTVDYFPHQCRHGKTIYILKEKYKHVGYAFWFTLLEELGSAEGHFIDCNNPTTMRFLQATTMTDGDLCNEILDLLAEIEAIDPELWKEKIIWSDNFVEGISSVYVNRRVENPTKPSFYKKKHGRVEVSTCRNPHSKVKESKVDEIIVNEDTPSQKMQKFLLSVQEKNDDFLKLVKVLSDRGIKEEVAIMELEKFARYWTERTKSGKKERWETEKTFEVNRRLATWFGNLDKWQKPNKPDIDVSSVMF